jgi:acetyl-CoA carboxylase carboxyl transferase subunit alpha
VATRVPFTTEFEKPLVALESKIEELKQLSGGAGVDFSDEIVKLERKAKRLQAEIFKELTRWQVVQLARHPNRPYTLDYVQAIFTDWMELEGDRRFGADHAIVAGLARFEGAPVVIVGEQKGRGTKENMLRNFGMPRPEGYRKARRLYDLADRFRRPLITGVGGSGGALALGVTNKILMLEYSTYSVISPESCSSILYRDASKAQKSAENLKLTARDLAGFGIVDEVVKEAPGGAHRDPKLTAENVAGAIRRQLADLRALTPEQLVRQRYQKYRAMGVFTSEE